MLKQLHVDLQAFLLLAPVKRSLFAQPNIYSYPSKPGYFPPSYSLFFQVILGILGTQYTPFDPPRLFVVGAEKCLHFPCNYCPRRQCNFPSYQMPKRKEQAWELRVFTRKQISSDLCTTYYNPSRLHNLYKSVPKKSSDPNKCEGINKRVQDRPSRGPIG